MKRDRIVEFSYLSSADFSLREWASGPGAKTSIGWSRALHRARLIEAAISRRAQMIWCIMASFGRHLVRSL